MDLGGATTSRTLGNHILCHAFTGWLGSTNVGLVPCRSCAMTSRSQTVSAVAVQTSLLSGCNDTAIISRTVRSTKSDRPAATISFCCLWHCVSSSAGRTEKPSGPVQPELSVIAAPGLQHPLSLCTLPTWRHLVIEFESARHRAWIEPP